MPNWKEKKDQPTPKNPLWTEFIDEDTGKSSIEVHTLKKISNWDNCKHFWKLIDSNGNIQCQKCGMGHRIVWGIEFIKNGKILKNEAKKD